MPFKMVQSNVYFNIFHPNYWLSSRKFFEGSKVNSYANFYCYDNFSVVFEQNFRELKPLREGKLFQVALSSAPLRKKARLMVHLTFFCGFPYPFHTYRFKIFLYHVPYHICTVIPVKFRK